MAEDENAIDELSERIDQLSEEDRAHLLESLREDRLSAYLDARGEFMDALREEGLIGRYPEDSPWADYCEQHPNDPLCWRMLASEEGRDTLRKYQRARGRFADRLHERGLMTERADRLESFADEIGLTPLPDGPVVPWKPPWWICIRYPWICDYCFWQPWKCFGTKPAPKPIPIPDPGPLGPESMMGSSMGPMMGGPMGMGAMAAGPMGMQAMEMGPVGMGQMGERTSGWADRPGELPIPPGGFRPEPIPPLPPIDICRYLPHLPQCRPQLPCWLNPNQPQCRPLPCWANPYQPGCRCPPRCYFDPGLPECQWCW